VGILAPILAGALLGIISINGIFLIDLATLVVALVFLLLVIIPEPKRKPRGRGFGAFFKELAYGFRYLVKRPSLLHLQLVFFLGNFFATIAFTLLNPMILAATASQSTVLATVQSVGAIGGLVGGIILTAWGGPKKKIHGVLVGWIVTGLGLALLGLGRSLVYWMGASFLTMTVLPIVNGANQAIWQSKTAPAVQGRVFSVRRLIAQVTAPLSMAVAGPLADRVFEPAMSSEGSWLGRLLGPVFGLGPGAGMSILISISGILVLCVGLGAYRNRLVLHVEELIPDHDEED
jgi:MFS family permease